MSYLVDTSALVRIIRKEVEPGWADQADRGLLSVCEPVLAEALLLADTTKYHEVFRVGERALRSVPASDGPG